MFSVVYPDSDFGKFSGMVPESNFGGVSGMVPEWFRKRSMYRLRIYLMGSDSQCSKCQNWCCSVCGAH